MRSKLVHFFNKKQIIITFGSKEDSSVSHNNMTAKRLAKAYKRKLFKDNDFILALINNLDNYAIKKRILVIRDLPLDINR